MSATKPNIQNPGPVKQASEKEKPLFKGAPAGAEDVGFVEDILKLLRRDEAMGVWCRIPSPEQTDIFIVLADKLTPRDKEHLSEFADLVIHTKDDLLKRLVALEKENQYLESLSLTDGLTGLYNYRFFSKQLQIEMARTRRTGQPCVLMMIDLDNFKVLNDTRGHDEGNRFIVTASSEMVDRLRPTDIMCRYGGDEFAVIMPATTLHDAIHIAHRLRESVAEIPTELDKPLSVSLGLAQYDPNSSQESRDFINLADKALYEAKSKGKNRLCYAGSLPELDKEAAVTSDEKAALLHGKHRE